MRMMINRRMVYGGKKGLLPSGYRLLDYIENTGNEYILTKILMSPTCAIDMKVTSYSQGFFKSGMVCGGYAWSRSNFSISVLWENSGVYGGVAVTTANTVHKSETTAVTPQTHIIQANPNIGVAVDGEYIYSSAFNACQLPRLPYFAVFGVGGESPTTINKSVHPARIHYCRLYEADHDLINLIPCVNPQGDVGMFDLVSQQFFGNDGEGEFIAGPDK